MHLGRVISDKCQIVHPLAQASAVQFPRLPLIKRRFRIVNPIQRQVVLAKIAYRGNVVGVQANPLLVFRDRFFILPERSGIGAQVDMRNCVSRITLDPQQVGLGFLLQFAGGVCVAGRDVKFFSRAYSIPQAIRLLQILQG